MKKVILISLSLILAFSLIGCGENKYSQYEIDDIKRDFEIRSMNVLQEIEDFKDWYFDEYQSAEDAIEDLLFGAIEQKNSYIIPKENIEELFEGTELGEKDFLEKINELYKEIGNMLLPNPAPKPTEIAPKTTTQLTSTSIPTKIANEASRIVYTYPSGKRYHFFSTCSGANSRETTLEKAKSQGYTPCQKCTY
ncbi:MAG: hypothetical protein FWE47_00020 [Oscillospiraceae bacterium]|nr:hypothetical protein [Oscillospiraceae bacterium]